MFPITGTQFETSAARTVDHAHQSLAFLGSRQDSVVGRERELSYLRRWQTVYSEGFLFVPLFRQETPPGGDSLTLVSEANAHHRLHAITGNFFGQSRNQFPASSHYSRFLVEEFRGCDPNVGKNDSRIVLDQLRSLFREGTTDDLTDGQLLERFATSRDELAERAFATLVERHGAMVLRVCRGVLGDSHDVHDAFQATFLVLVRKARSLWVKDSLGPWLHQVALRTAAYSRRSAARRKRLERQATPRSPALTDRPLEDPTRILHEEIERLPDRFRVPIVLCDLEGRTHEQAARHLGWPIGTVKSRQSRAREQLRARLVRRGVGTDEGLLEATLILPPSLAQSTINVALNFVSVQKILEGSTMALAQGVLWSMSLSRWLKVAAALAVATACVSGIGLLAQGSAPAVPKAAEGARQADAVNNAQIVELQPGAFSVVLSERGYLESSRNENVYCMVQGPGVTILSIVPEGSLVRKGDVVCELDSADLRDRLVNQQITINKAMASYNEARLDREVAELAVAEYAEGTSRQDQEVSSGDITTATSSIQKANDRLNRTRAAREQFNAGPGGRPGNASSADIMARLDIEDRIAAAEQTIEREKIVLDLAKTKRKVLDEFTRPKMIKVLSSAVERQRTKELAMKAALELETSKGRSLERQIKACTIKAPADGIALYANDPSRVTGQKSPQFIEEGATVRERQVILSIPNLAKMQMNAKIPQSEIAKVAPGMKARVRIDAFPGKVWSGTVRVVAPLPDPLRVGDPDTRYYTAHVSIDDPPPGIRPGMTAQVEIVVREAENVLSVPVQAVLSFDGKDHVAVKKPGGGFEWRAVTLGPANDKFVEIKEGLERGQSVSTEPISLMSESEKREKLGKPKAPAVIGSESVKRGDASRPKGKRPQP